MKIGIIGIGQIGSTLVRQFAKTGHQVSISNASDIHKLQALENETGAKALPIKDIATGIDVLVVSIPFKEVPELASNIRPYIPENTIIIDTTNYYPIRDGKIEDIENGMYESVWVSTILGKPVIKVYNSILAGSLLKEGLPAGAGNRIALPISGDEAAAKHIVSLLVNDSGFDSVDIGNLSQSWKQQPGSPVYCTDLTTAQLKNNLNGVQRELLADRRELALQFILQHDFNDWLGWYKACVANNRIVYQTQLKP